MNKFTIDNIDLLAGSDMSKTEYNHPFLPSNNFRMIISAFSGAGKTNLLLNMILKRWINYDKIYLICPTDEVKYDALEEHFADIENEINNKAQIMAIKKKKDYTPIKLFHRYMNIDDMIKVDELDKNFTNLIIFDDCAALPAKKKELISDFFIRARKYNASLIYITQSYFDIPKKIRLQCNLLILWYPSDTRELIQYHGIFGGDLSFNEFKQLMNNVKKIDRRSFLLINMDKEPNDGKYSVNLELLYIPNNA